MRQQRFQLTHRELEVLSLIAGGLTDSEIAARLGIARGTVSNHVSVIFLKLGAARRTAAVSCGFRLGLLADADALLQVENYRLDEPGKRSR